MLFLFNPFAPYPSHRLWIKKDGALKFPKSIDLLNTRFPLSVWSVLEIVFSQSLSLRKMKSHAFWEWSVSLVLQYKTVIFEGNWSPYTQMPESHLMAQENLRTRKRLEFIGKSWSRSFVFLINPSCNFNGN